MKPTDARLILKLTKSFRRTAGDLAPRGGPEVVDAGIDFLIWSMTEEIGEPNAVAASFAAALVRAINRARQGRFNGDVEMTEQIVFEQHFLH